MNMSQFNSPFPSPSPSTSSNYSFSQSPFEDLTKCNQHKFWKTVIRGLNRYLTCFKRMKSGKGDAKFRGHSSVDYSKFYGRNYSEMSEGERAEKLKAAILYCKENLKVKGEEKQSCESDTAHHHNGPLCRSDNMATNMVTIP